MISLIGNELKKIFKKKTIYILLIIIIGYVILNNIIVKSTYNNSYSNYYYSELDLQYVESYLSELDPNDSSQLADFVSFTNQKETLTLTLQYGNNSWQAYVINTKLTGYLDTIIEYLYTDNVSEEEYTKAKDAYDEALKRFEANDWKYFVQEDLADVEASIDEQQAMLEDITDFEIANSIKKNIANLEVEKQIDEWRLEKNISYASSFFNDAINKYYYNQTTLNKYSNININNLSDDELEYYNYALETANLNKYYIENNISLESNSRRIFIDLFENYGLFILLVGIVISGSIVSEEFNRGTIKLLLVKPYNRIKILLSKFIVCMIILVLTIAFIYVFQLICGGIINEFEGMTIPAIVYNFDTNKVESINIFAYVALIGVCKLPIYILLTTLSFACSTIFTNTALAVAVPFLGYIVSNLINQFALAYDIRQIIYFVTPNWDLSVYLFGGSPLFDGLTLLFSVIVCLVYLIIMLLISCTVFKNRDIKNI